MSAHDHLAEQTSHSAASEWGIYRGTGRPLHDIHLADQLPPPPSWRRFRREPPDEPGAPPDDELEAERRLGAEFHLAEADVDPREIDMVNAALFLRRPLLVTGKPGSGKSALAYRIARELRIGRVLRWSITSCTTLQSGTYYYDAIGCEQAAATWYAAACRTGTNRATDIDELEIGDFVRLGPVGTAFLPTRTPRVLLIDELDKSDADLSNDLLSIFEDAKFGIPELERIRAHTPSVQVFASDRNRSATIADGRVACAAFPVIVITRNGEWELPAAFLCRCLRLEKREPDAGQLATLVANHMFDKYGHHTDRLIREFVARSAALDGLLAKWLVAARHDGDVAIVEVATAERAVQDELWWPVTKQRRERWLDLTVVVDAAPSMTLWRHKVAAFVEVLEQLGAFRTIRVRRLDTNRFSAGVPLPPVLSGDTGPRDPAEVIDHAGRGVVLVLTDGLGEAWRGDLIGPVLARWGRAMSVSVVHLLPQWMWSRRGPALHRAMLSATAELAPNRAWSVSLPDAWRAEEPEHILPEGAVPVPVLELGARWLGWWARQVTGGHQSPVPATVLLATEKPRPRVTTYENPREPLSPRARVADFLHFASPAGQRLARLLAALPADLDVIRMVQREFLPGSGAEHIAELLAGGLLRYASRTAPHGSTVDIGDIARSDREILLEGARRSETARVVRTAAHQHGHRIGALALLRDAIADPAHAREPTAKADRTLQSLALRALSGTSYPARVDWLDLRSSSISTVDVVPGPADPSADRTRFRPEVFDAAFPDDLLESVTMSHGAEPATLQDNPATTSTPRRLTTSPRQTRRSWCRHCSYLTPEIDIRSPAFGDVPLHNFTGAKDLTDQLLLHQLGFGDLAAVFPAALHSMGGIGKTQTAVEYIYRHLDDYDLVWWILTAQQDRNFVARLLIDRLGSLQIDESRRIGPHVLSIVEVCARRADGLNALLDILGELDEGTIHMREVARIIAERDASELWPEEERERLFALLSGMIFKDLVDLYGQVAGLGAPELPAETTYRAVFATLENLNADPNGLPKPIVFVEHLAKGRRPELEHPGHLSRFRGRRRPAGPRRSPSGAREAFPVNRLVTPGIQPLRWARAPQFRQDKSRTHQPSAEIAAVTACRGEKAWHPGSEHHRYRRTALHCLMHRRFLRVQPPPIQLRVSHVEVMVSGEYQPDHDWQELLTTIWHPLCSSIMETS